MTITIVRNKSELNSQNVIGFTLLKGDSGVILRLFHVKQLGEKVPRGRDTERRC